MRTKKKSTALTEKSVFTTPKVFECPFCKDSLSMSAWREPIVNHLIVTIDHRGYIHVHGPLDDRSAIDTMVKAVQVESDKYQVVQ